MKILRLGFAILAAVTFSQGETYPGLVLDDDFEYYDDDGKTYGERGNGLRYGWNSQQTPIQRKNFASPSIRHDQFMPLPDGAEWEIEVPNGEYRVIIGAGDPDNLDAHYKILVEGISVIDAVPSSEFPWVAGTEQVIVSDGKLTVRGGAGAKNNVINYISIVSPMYGVPSDQPQTAELPLLINCAGPSVHGYLGDRKWRENAAYGFPMGGFVPETPEQEIYCSEMPLKDRFLEGEEFQNTDIDEVYRTMLISLSEERTHLYNVRVPNGTYDVTLLLTHEWRLDRPGTITFEIEDKSISANIIEESGNKNHVGIEKTLHNVTVEDGLLEIYGTKIAGAYSQPTGICGLKVTEAGTTPIEHAPVTGVQNAVCRLRINNSVLLSIDLSSVENSKGRIHIHDSRGRQVLSLDATAGETDTSLPSTGLYFVGTQHRPVQQITLVK